MNISFTLPSFLFGKDENTFRKSTIFANIRHNKKRKCNDAIQNANQTKG